MSNSDNPNWPRMRSPIPVAKCALVAAVQEIGDRWSLLIIREAFYGVMRYDDMRLDLGIPRSVLTDRLAKLVGCGLLEKLPYQEPGDRQRFAYGLTEKGRALATSFIALTQWGEDYVLARPGPASIVDRSTGKEVGAALVDEDGALVDPSNVVAKPR